MPTKEPYRAILNYAGEYCEAGEELCHSCIAAAVLRNEATLPHGFWCVPASESQGVEKTTTF